MRTRTSTRRRHARLSIEHLEERAMMDAMPALHSYDGAPHTLFLDFDGHVNPFGTAELIDGPEVVVDDVALPVVADTGSLTLGQEYFVRQVWGRVADDFSPFAIDVTTVEPVSLAPGATDADANNNALRIAVGPRGSVLRDVPNGYVPQPEWGWTPYEDALTNASDTSTTDYFVPLPEGIAGIANGGAFPENGALTYPYINEVANVGYADYDLQSEWFLVAETVSHEAGHLLGLMHQSDEGDSNGSAIMYSGGTAVSTAWRSVWSEGESLELREWVDEGLLSDAWQDDVAHLRSVLGSRPDEPGHDFASAQQMEFVRNGGAGGTHLVFASGVIGTRNDVDYYKFAVTDVGRAVISLGLGVDVDPNANVFYAEEHNLRAEMELWTSDGTQKIADLGPWGSLPVLASGQTSSDGSLHLNAGEQYVIVVSGAGEYADLGAYEVKVDGPVDLGPRIIQAMVGPAMNVNSAPAVSVADHVIVTFDRPVDPATFTTDDVTIRPQFFPWPIRPISVNVVDPADPRSFRINFRRLTAPGTYTIEIGPEIEAPLAGGTVVLRMDQDQDGTGGEAVDDVKRITFDLRTDYHSLRDIREQGVDKFESAIDSWPEPRVPIGPIFPIDAKPSPGLVDRIFNRDMRYGDGSALLKGLDVYERVVRTPPARPAADLSMQPGKTGADLSQPLSTRRPATDSVANASISELATLDGLFAGRASRSPFARGGSPRRL